MYLNEEAKAIFLCHPRTASRSTSKFLGEHGFERISEETAKRQFLKVSPVGHHARLLEPPHGSNWVVGCTVRHHFDLVASWLFSTKLKKWDGTDESLENLQKSVQFPEYLNSLYTMGKAHYYPEPNSLFCHLEFATDVIQFNNVFVGLSTFMSRAGLLLNSQVSLSHLGELPRRGCPTEKALLPEWRRHIVDRYHDEMLALGYLVDEKVVGYEYAR